MPAAVQRAGTWVAVKLRYCQAPNGGKDMSSACPRICSRQKNPAWDKYRSNCNIEHTHSTEILCSLNGSYFVVCIEDVGLPQTIMYKAVRLVDEC